MKHFHDSDDEKETDDGSETSFWSKYNSFSSIKITDITSNEINQEILQRLKDNDDSFDKLRILHPPYPWVGTSDNNDYYTIIDGEDIVWLGYYIGQSTKLQNYISTQKLLTMNFSIKS